MSERDKVENARRKGKKAYWAGLPIDDNPMRASCSWVMWREAWLHERNLHEASKAAWAKRDERGGFRGQ